MARMDDERQDPEDTNYQSNHQAHRNAQPSLQWTPAVPNHPPPVSHSAYGTTQIHDFGYPAQPGEPQADHLPQMWNQPSQPYASPHPQHSSEYQLNNYGYGEYPNQYQYPQAYQYQYQPPPLFDAQHFQIPPRLLPSQMLPSPSTSRGLPAASLGLGLFPRHDPSGDSATPTTVFEQVESRLAPILHDIRNGVLHLAATQLVELSRWLLGNAQQFKLHEDNEAQDSTRLKMWHDFNNTWLALLQKQIDLTNGQPEETRPAASSAQRLHSQDLDHMHVTLSRLCDPLEIEGLVDWERGVWEKQICEVVRRCIDLTRPVDGHVPSPTSTTTPQPVPSYTPIPEQRHNIDPNHSYYGPPLS